MWTEKTKSGKVRFIERFKNPTTERTSYVSITLDKDTKLNRKLALEALNAKINQRLVVSNPESVELTLSQLVDLYLDDIEHTYSKATYVRNKHACASLCRILDADSKVNKLNAGYVRRCLLSEGEAPGTTNERLTRFKALMRWGYKNDLIESVDWLDKLEKLEDREKREKLERKFLEREELTTLLDAMTDQPMWHHLTKMCALSGLRVGEAIALDANDLDFESRVIHVTGSLDPVNEIITPCKTRTSVRDVYMQEELLTLCHEIVDYANVRRERYRYHSSLLFAMPDGSHVHYYAFNKYLREASQAVLGRPITTHYLRHTHVALLAEQGIPLDVISRRLGHSDSKVTRDVYFHVTERMKKRDQQLLDRVSLLK